ncbi:MAG TPA: SCP-2 sterol transfer family protein [Gammaproteobacteria bacterium]|nr:SCP-2 sterol transfer family protein [Gammaproteobacteria bacterium]
MADLFSDEWMKSYMDAWNNEPDLSDALADINFSSVIGYGFVGDDGPTGVITVENGKVVSAGAYKGESLSWDIRAKPANWEKWLSKGIGMAGLGMAYTTGKMKFAVGDYSAMLKDPRMAGPFIKSFSVMGLV